MIGGLSKTKDGKKLILLGLSEGNLKKMRDGQPLYLAHSTHPYIPEGYVITIFTGETEEAMMDQLKKAGIELRGPYGDGSA